MYVRLILFFSDPHWPGKVSSVVGNMGPCGPADLHLHSMAGFAWWYGYYRLIMYIYFMMFNPWLNKVNARNNKSSIARVLWEWRNYILGVVM